MKTIKITLRTVPAGAVDSAAFKVIKIIGDIKVYATQAIGAGDRITEQQAEQLVAQRSYEITTIPYN